jgi:hypothetical protein
VSSFKSSSLFDRFQFRRSILEEEKRPSVFFLCPVSAQLATHTVKIHDLPALPVLLSIRAGIETISEFDEIGILDEK